MDPRHQEYVEYYRARLQRAEASRLYPETVAAERALFEAISTASDLEEFARREQEGRLALACAIARVRDVERAEASFYLELEETVRAQPHLEVLRRLDEAPPASAADLNSLVSEIHSRWLLAISGDETLRDEFWGDWKILEDIECDERAEVPGRWRAEREAAVARELERGARHFREHTIPSLRKFVPDYEPDWQQLWQLRHRRLFPLADAVVAERIEGHRRYVGVR